MTASYPWARFIVPYQTVFGLAGQLASASLYFYASGTTTPLATYSDAALSIANTNPVVADASGTFGNIFLQQLSYRVILKDSNGAQIWSGDPVAVTPGSAAGSRSLKKITVADTPYTAGVGELILVDASGGAVSVVVTPSLFSSSVSSTVTVQRTDTTGAAYQVTINDGTSNKDYITSVAGPTSGIQCPYRDVDGDGTSIFTKGIG